MPAFRASKYIACLVILISAAATPGMGQVPQSRVLYLDGNGSYLYIPDAKFLNFDPAADLTLELRFKSFTQAPFSLFNKWFPDHCQDRLGKGWLLDINRRPCMIGDDCFGEADGLAAVNQPGASRLAYIDCFSVSYTDTGFQMVPNVWLHFAISFQTQPEFTRVTTRFYNGDTLITATKSIVNSDFVTTGQPLYIGGLPDIVDSTLYMHGLIDEVRVWNTVRSSAQIMATLNDTLGPEYTSSLDSGLVAYYRFEELVDVGVNEDLLVDDILDLSFTGNNADIVGTAVLVDSDFVTSVERGDNSAPSAHRLYQNHPNPFNPGTQITIEFRQSSRASLSIYNTSGQLIRAWTERTFGPGRHTVFWDGRDEAGRPVASGVYLYAVRSPGFVAIRKMVRLK